MVQYFLSHAGTVYLAGKDSMFSARLKAVLRAKTHLRRLELAVLVVFAFTGISLAEPAGPDYFPSFADEHTVALWLFDEPDYLNTTLTDAGENWYDLRVADGKMVPGKFGNALNLRSEKRAAAVFASHSRGLADPPEKLLRTLAESGWTVEFVFRTDALADCEFVIIEIGPGKIPDFHLALSTKQQGFLIYSRICGLALLVPTDPKTLSNGEWHHVAFTRGIRDDTVRHYLDGVLQPEPKPADNNYQLRDRRLKPGLIGINYGNSFFTGFGASEKNTHVNFSWGESRGKVWSQRWRGLIKGPVSGWVAFSAESNAGFSLKIGDRIVIDGKMGAAVRSGSMNMVKDRLYPVTLSYRVEGKADNHLRLFWSWQGQQRHLVPEGAFWYTNEDLKKAGIAYDSEDFVIGLRPPGQQPVSACIDELRISDAVRYEKTFLPPGSFSRNYLGQGLPRKSVATGPAPLFGPETPPGVLQFGARKHLFIDDAIFERYENLKFAVNPPRNYKATDFITDQPWEGDPGKVMGPRSLYEVNDRIALEYTNSSMWVEPDRDNLLYVAFSDDGLHFEKPGLGCIEWQGSRQNNIVLKGPVQGNIFFDTNPNALHEERFKFTAYFMTRGIYLFMSPDGVHWRRNETIMLPIDCGGGAEGFWDDQRGRYVCYIRHEAYATRGKGKSADVGGRAAAVSVTDEVTKPWPFKRLERPLRKEPLPLPASTGELPTPFYPTESGQPYRTRATKYQWAPDTFLAFVWRIHGNDHTSRQTELAVSRDGLHWKNYGGSFYIPNGWEFEGIEVLEALSCNGLIRRKDEIWQYAHLRGDKKDVFCRSVQRLDGFVSLDASSDSGWAVTNPMVIEGRRLILNVKAKGTVRVGFLNTDCTAVTGFGVKDCDPIKVDSVGHRVSWHGKYSLSSLAGRIVRLQFEMQNAKLFAFEIKK